MKFLFIVGNWKSYKTQAESLEWLKIFYSKPLLSENKEVIICPPYPLLPGMLAFKLEVNRSDNALIRFGAQDISPFDEGAFTGEVSGRLLQEFAAYTVIGHSERRQNFGETDELLAQKVEIAKKYNITPIYCVQGKETIIPSGVTIVAYEPISAIGTGNPDSPESAEEVAKFIKENNKGVNYVLYGGSVKPDNVNSFTKQPHIDGVLVGGASLDAEKFSQIVQNA